jgi:uncharacterized membrane protein YhhN
MLPLSEVVALLIEEQTACRTGWPPAARAARSAVLIYCPWRSVGPEEEERPVEIFALSPRGGGV